MYNLNFGKLTLMTGFVVQGSHISKTFFCLFVLILFLQGKISFSGKLGSIQSKLADFSEPIGSFLFSSFMKKFTYFHILSHFASDLMMFTNIQTRK